MLVGAIMAMGITVVNFVRFQADIAAKREDFQVLENLLIYPVPQSVTLKRMMFGVGEYIMLIVR
jgi:hypothetical protein